MLTDFRKLVSVRRRVERAVKGSVMLERMFYISSHSFSHSMITLVKVSTSSNRHIMVFMIMLNDYLYFPLPDPYCDDFQTIIPSPSVGNQSPVLPINTCSCQSTSQLSFTSSSSIGDSTGSTRSLLSPSSMVLAPSSSASLTCSGMFSFHFSRVHLSAKLTEQVY